MHLVSRDSSLVLLSAAAGDVGRGSLDIFIADGTSNASFWAHGLERHDGRGAHRRDRDGLHRRLRRDHGRATRRWTSRAWPPTSTPSIRWIPSTCGSASPAAARRAWRRSRRCGRVPPVWMWRCSAPIPRWACCRPPARWTTRSPCASRPASSQSPTSVAAGGVAFDGVGLGTVTVRPEIPGFLPTANAIRQVTVSQPGIITNGVAATVGAGLQASNSYVQLGATGHGGVTVRRGGGRTVPGPGVRRGGHGRGRGPRHPRGQRNQHRLISTCRGWRVRPAWPT